MKILTLNIETLTDAELFEVLPHGYRKKVGKECGVSSQYVSLVLKGKQKLVGIEAITKANTIRTQARELLRSYKKKVQQEMIE